MNEYFEKIRLWYNKEPSRIFIISGYAGCGKTTLARQIPDFLNLGCEAIFLTPTGKAATALHKRAQTIHSYLYVVEEDKRTGKLIFYKKDYDLLTEKLLIVDEISMVNEELLTDLRSTGIPIIGLGDPAQLPPVNGSNDILSEPDIFLTKVYRNDGGILELATDIRTGSPLKKEYDSVQFRRNSIIRDFHLLSDDSIIICRYNKTRQTLNNMIRKKIKQFSDAIEVGEKLMILNNNKMTGLMNGSIVTVTKILYINKEYHFADIEVVDDSNMRQVIRANLYIVFDAENKLSRNFNERMHTVDYAYAITCHKSQGSEFKDVFVIIEGEQYDDFRNWLYTAVTRTRSNLYVYKHF